MLKALLKVQIAAFLSIFTGASRNKKKKSALGKVGFALLMVYAFGCVAMLFGMIFSELRAPFRALGLDWLYFTMAGIMGFALMFVGSVFTAKAQLFEAKDNERLLSMPIAPSVILLSRMLGLYLLNFALGLLAMVPPMVVWGFGNCPPAGLLGFVLELLLLPLLSLAVSCLFAWLISLLTGLFPGKKIVTTILYFVFFGAYMVFCMRMNTYILQLAAMGEVLAGSLGAIAPLYWLGAAVTGDVWAVLGISALCIAAFAALYILLSRSFIRIVTTRRAARREVYEKEELQVTAPRKALLQRELRHLVSNSTYMLNCGLGPVFLLVGCVVLPIKGRELSQALSALPLPEGAVPVLVMAIVSALAGLAPFTACSVSLEGRSLWQLQSMPVSAWEVLEAKLRLSELMTVPPTVLLCLSAFLVLRLEAAEWILLTLCAVWFVRLSAKIGLMEDLRHGKLDWINEAAAVKQSLSVLFTMGIDFALTVTLGGVWFAVNRYLSAVSYLSAVLVVLVLLERLVGSWLRKKGAEAFADIG